MNNFKFKDYPDLTTPFSASNLNKLIPHKYSLPITETTSAGANITIPCYYKVGADVLDVYLNGERLILSSDDTGTDGHYREVGTSGSISNIIKTTSDWYLEDGDMLEFEVKGEYEDET